MEIHNLMEDQVFRRVNEICDEEEQRGNSDYCTSKACRLDVVCYVLNRIPPRYVTSGRGVAHVEQTIVSDTQLAVDITKLAQEALKRVSTVRRSYYDEEPTEPKLHGPSFNFPAIAGRIFDGENFVPMEGALVYLLHDESSMEMYDSRWQNPYPLASHTYGMYSFWPAPQPATTSSETRSFDLQICAQAEGYDRLDHFFTLSLEADEGPSDSRRMGGDFHLPDLYMSPI